MTTACTSASSSSPCVSPSSTSAAANNKCFNSRFCTASKSRRAWRLRSGHFAYLCDRCASIHEEGRFCETFHLNSMGWRSCESCRKRVHCGCIVSANTFTCLDADGIECWECTKKNVNVKSNPLWPPSMFYNDQFPHRLKDTYVKTWNHLAGSGPVPWRQAPSLFNSSFQPDVLPQIPCEGDRFRASELFSASSPGKVKIENILDRSTNASLKLGTCDVLWNGSIGTNIEGLRCSPLNASRVSSLRECPPIPRSVLPIKHSFLDETNGRICHSDTSLLPAFLPPLGRQFDGEGVDSFVSGQISNAVSRMDACRKTHLIPKYKPRFTYEELQQISGNTNFIVTPLFEKMLTASDVGPIGRLVLPKKCAEAYLPPISKPEGQPLKVQDCTGKEWQFQFRFWTNNNSRMYVMEGITPWIKNLGLQAGDIVTFSRIEPHGKLIMGFKKAATPLTSDQDELADHRRCSKVGKSGCTTQQDLEAKSSPKRGKSSALGSKSKRLRFENELMIELKITWEKAQVLLCPPPDHVPSVVVIEGYEFEEYKDAPTLGPKISATEEVGSPCSYAKESTEERSEDLLLLPDLATSEKMKDVRHEKDNVGEEKAQPGIPGCSSIACFQSRSGVAPRHEQSCICDECRSINWLSEPPIFKHEEKQSEEEAGTPGIRKQKPLPEMLLDEYNRSQSNNCENDSCSRTELSPILSKGQIDLNIKPERIEECPPGLDSETTMNISETLVRNISSGRNVQSPNVTSPN